VQLSFVYLTLFGNNRSISNNQIRRPIPTDAWLNLTHLWKLSVDVYHYEDVGPGLIFSQEEISQSPTQEESDEDTVQDFLRLEKSNRAERLPPNNVSPFYFDEAYAGEEVPLCESNTIPENVYETGVGPSLFEANGLFGEPDEDLVGQPNDDSSDNDDDDDVDGDNEELQLGFFDHLIQNGDDDSSDSDGDSSGND